MTRQILLKFSIFCSLLLAGLSSGVQAGQSVWNHNGSQMLLQSNGNERVISYLVPRRGISAKPGQVLFRGVRKGQTYVGAAYTFRRGCAPAPYQVQGVLSFEHEIVLRGASPLRSGCQITGYTRNSGNSVLVFTYIERAGDQGAGVGESPQQEPPFDPGFAGSQEGPQEGPIEHYTQLIPGGQIIFRIQDEDAPATTPIRIDAYAQCVGGRRIEVLNNYRTCAFDSFGKSADGNTLIIYMRSFGGNSCSNPLSQSLRVGDLCR